LSRAEGHVRTESDGRLRLGNPDLARRSIRPGWLAPSCVAVSVAGLGVSAYLTAAHFTSATILACSAGGLVNCEQVTTSAQSELMGIPVAILGLTWFAAMGMLTSGPAWRSSSTPVVWARLTLAVTGMGFVLYLLYAELFTIGAICLWCTAAHVLAFVLFVLVMVHGSGGTGKVHPRQT
jgi:uncharacterized membrane protein